MKFILIILYALTMIVAVNYATLLALEQFQELIVRILSPGIIRTRPVAQTWNAVGSSKLYMIV